jgi:hypothetical protein
MIHQIAHLRAVVGIALSSNEGRVRLQKRWSNEKKPIPDHSLMALHHEVDW